MPFRSLGEFLTGADSVRRMGEQAKEAARAQYDPSILSPQLSMFRELATEGIEDEAAIARTGAIGQLFRDVDTSLAGGNQGRALAMQQQQNQAATQGLADFERGIAQADIQARRQGQEGFAQAQTQQNQIRAQREAAIETADLQTQAEIDRRKGALGSTIGSLAGTIAGSFLGPVGAAAAGGLGGAVFGGGQGALTGAATGATTAIQQDMFGTQEEGGEVNPQTDTQDVFDIANFLQMDFSGNDEAQTEQSIQRNVMGDMGAEYQPPQYLLDLGKMFPSEILGQEDGIDTQEAEALPDFDIGQYELRDYLQQGGQQFEEPSFTSEESLQRDMKTFSTEWGDMQLPLSYEEQRMQGPQYDPNFEYYKTKDVSWGNVLKNMLFGLE